jgi:hypothetical protein
MRRSFINCGSLAALFCCLIAGGPGTPAGADEKADAKDKINNIRRARLGTLEEIYELLRTAQPKGGATLNDVRDARVAVLNARLDLGESSDDRVKILQELVTETRGWEDETNRAAEAGKGTRIDAVRAKLRRVDAELALAQEKAKGEK